MGRLAVIADELVERAGKCFAPGLGMAISSVLCCTSLKHICSTHVGSRLSLAWRQRHHGPVLSSPARAHQTASVCPDVPAGVLGIDAATTSALAAAAVQLRSRLAQHMGERLGQASTHTAALRLDSTVGGVAARRALTSTDAGVDFGHGVYNDHHYHRE